MSLLNRTRLNKTTYWEEKKGELEQVLLSFNRDLKEFSAFDDTFSRISIMQKIEGEVYIFSNTKRDMLISIIIFGETKTISISGKPYTKVTLNF